MFQQPANPLYLGYLPGDSSYHLTLEIQRPAASKNALKDNCKCARVKCTSWWSDIFQVAIYNYCFYIVTVRKTSTSTLSWSIMFWRLMAVNIPMMGVAKSDCAQIGP